MSFAYRESTVLAALLVLVAALIPILISENGTKSIPDHENVPGNHPGTSLANFQWRSLLSTFWATISIPLHAISIPVQALVSATLVVLHPIILAFKFMFAIIFFPFKLLIGLAMLLYPIYVFLGAACIVGLVTGIIGKHTLQLLVYLWREKPSGAKPIEGKDTPRGRNQKRKDVGAQAYYNRRKTRRYVNTFAFTVNPF